MIGRLRRRLYALSFVDEFGPVYAVYTLWFNDNGIDATQLSTVFLVWALISLVLEIPSGALADRVDRRHLLATAFGLRAVGIAVWLVWPTFPGALLGAALWAVHDAFASGSWEAMIHDQLTAVGAASRYAPVMARIGQFSNLGVAVGTVLGAGLLRLDVGLVALGWLTVAANLVTITLVVALPDVRWVAETARQPHGVTPAGAADGRRSPLGLWWATLRQGLDEARGTPVLARLVVVGALLEGLFLIDEYVPLVSRARGGADAVAPIIVLIVWLGLLAGGEVAARRPALPGRFLGLALVAGMAITALGFLGGAVWTLVLLAVGYAALETAWVATDARLQERTAGATRATVTSVRSFGSACVSMSMFAVVGLLSDGDDPTPGLFVMIAALVVAGLLVVRWLPPASTSRPLGADAVEPTS